MVPINVVVGAAVNAVEKIKRNYQQLFSLGISHKIKGIIIRLYLSNQNTLLRFQEVGNTNKQGRSQPRHG